MAGGVDARWKSTVTLLLLLLTPACVREPPPIDAVTWVSLIQEVVESNIAGRTFEHVFVVEGRFTEPSDARRSVPVDDLRFYRPERLAPEQRDSLSERGYRICSLEHGAACPKWAEEPTALVVVMGIQETLDPE